MQKRGIGWSHRLSGGSESGLSLSFGSFGLFFCSSLLACLCLLGQLFVVQFGLDKSFKVSSTKTFVVCFANDGKKLIQILDCVAQGIQCRGIIFLQSENSVSFRLQLACTGADNSRLSSEGTIVQ